MKREVSAPVVQRTAKIIVMQNVIDKHTAPKSVKTKQAVTASNTEKKTSLPQKAKPAARKTSSAPEVSRKTTKKPALNKPGAAKTAVKRKPKEEKPPAATQKNVIQYDSDGNIIHRRPLINFPKQNWTADEAE